MLKSSYIDTSHTYRKWRLAGDLAYRSYQVSVEDSF